MRFLLALLLLPALAQAATITPTACWDGTYATDCPPHLTTPAFGADLTATSAVAVVTTDYAGTPIYVWAKNTSTPGVCATAPTYSQIVNGTGASATATIASPAVGVNQATLTGLSGGTEYCVWFFQRSATGIPTQSNAQLATYLADTDPWTKTGTEPSSIVFVADFETLSTGDFGGTQLDVEDGQINRSPGTAQSGTFAGVSTTTAYSGTKSFKATITYPTGVAYRAEIQTKGYPSFDATYSDGAEHWIGWAMRMESAYVLGPSQYSGLLFQMHSGATNAGVTTVSNPVLAFRPESFTDLLHLEMRYPSGLGLTNWTRWAPAGSVTDIRDGAWHRYVVQYVYRKAATGIVRLWIDDVLVIQRTSIVTWPSTYTNFGYYKFGIYTGSPDKPTSGERTIYYDAIRIADGALGGNYSTVDPASY